MNEVFSILHPQYNIGLLTNRGCNFDVNVISLSSLMACWDQVVQVTESMGNTTFHKSSSPDACNYHYFHPMRSLDTYIWVLKSCSLNWMTQNDGMEIVFLLYCFQLTNQRLLYLLPWSGQTFFHACKDTVSSERLDFGARCCPKVLLIINVCKYYLFNSF